MAGEPEKAWSSALLDCFEDINTCCYGFWCGPCLACTVSGRAAMRNRYHIKGSLCNDVAVSCFCQRCSWCQMHRELKYRNTIPVVINMQHQTVIQMQNQNIPQMQNQYLPQMQNQYLPQMQPVFVTTAQPQPVGSVSPPAYKKSP
ncbi:hypothetical protein KUCAC02_023283 [Chaenocephalus aceratus]|uniref:Uncharacterized protein n=1 Tax=Chaenocephalus aceratus TaxID=36190 RepID=A0ACB9XQU7_CHAAC|nr:hypothetical protein KUCAC02_023283 [Chaenocephalus aceratus]